MKSQLLPEGFRDSLPNLAELEYKINSIFLDLMKSNGFLMVKPPLVEFESSLFFLRKDKENLDSFRVMDPLSQKIMGIRSDMTMQIARISCGSLSKDVRPLRLCYVGEVLKVKNNNINMSRQFTQVGAEIIGVEKDFFLGELINLIIENLNKLGIKKFVVNFSMPNLINAIKKDFKLNKSDFEKVVNCYKNKNLQEIRNISDKLYKISEFLLGSVGRIEDKILHIKKFKFTKNLQLEIENFVSQIKKIGDDFKYQNFMIDPLEIDESEYHSGFCFKVYSENLKELFSGGGYIVKDENCCGFSGFLENIILESTIKLKEKKRILANFDLQINSKYELQKKGFIVIKSSKNLKEKNIISEAKRQRCKFYFLNNKVVGVN
ncbi:MAG: ATP phosphoribosyltransferase regulatory subunit [Pseudomonadota bacterium]|nr:ATP phosphoribosyltransferase regulatory subunit [Pseudomonadota bacterium]